MRQLVRIETAIIIVVILSLCIPVLAAASITLLSMIAWEIWRGFHGDTPFYSDLFADIVGTVLGSGLAWLTIIANTVV